MKLGKCRMRITPAGREAARAILDGMDPRGRIMDWDGRLKTMLTSPQFAAWKATCDPQCDAATAFRLMAPGLATSQGEIVRRVKAEEFSPPFTPEVLSDLHDFLSALWSRFGGEQ